MAKFANLKTLLIKKEVTYGVDPVPTGGANAILASNMKLRPMAGQDAVRKFDLPYFTAGQKLPTGTYAELSFDVELIGSVTPGTAPAWSAIAQACGLAETLSAGVSVTYNPISSGHASATAYFNMDGVRYILTGARGEAKAKLGVHGLPVLEVRLMGLFNQPTDSANPAMTVTAFQQPQVVDSVNTPTYTVNGVAMKARNLDLMIGNKLTFRELIGRKEIIIPAREASASLQVEAETLATFNPYTLAQNQTAFAVNVVHGVGAGKIVTLNMPNCRLSRPEENAEQDNIWEWPFTITPLPVSGNDEFTITLT